MSSDEKHYNGKMSVFVHVNAGANLHDLRDLVVLLQLASRTNKAPKP